MGQPARSRRKFTAEMLNFATPTARQQGEDARIITQSQRQARCRAINLEWNLVCERVADELSPNTMVSVERRLERQQTENQIAGLADRSHALLPPGRD